MLLQPGPILSTEQQQQQQPQPLQQQPHQFQQHAPNLLSAQQPSSLTSSSSASSTPPIQDVSRYLETLQEQLKEGWTAHTAKDGRLYYCKKTWFIHTVCTGPTTGLTNHPSRVTGTADAIFSKIREMSSM
uniref:WW domain-containing protein n=1 Tax=Anopheles farauti TaxID=69004 RepID=A0A182QAY2_9DIPT